MIRLLTALAAALLLWSAPGEGRAEDLAALLDTHREAIESGSRRAVGPAMAAIAASGAPRAQAVLEGWLERDLRLDPDGRFLLSTPDGLVDAATGAPADPAGEVEEIRPNGGVRRLLGAALVPLQLQDADPARREEALDSLARRARAEQLPALRASIDRKSVV